MTIIDILRILARFRRLALVVAVVTLAVGTFSALNPPDRYRATSTILVEPKLASGQAVSVQVIDFLVPSFIKTVDTRTFRRDAAERVPAGARGADMSVTTSATRGTGILTIVASGTQRAAVAPWAAALADQLVETIDSDFVDLVVIDEAVEPKSPYAPDRALILAVSAILALISAVLSAVIASALRGRGDSASELRERFGAAVLGEIPRMRASIADLSPAELLAHHGAARAVEALQTLRANVTIALEERPNPWLVVTSADQGEGKSFVATSLAWLLASVNRPTVLVEGDSRRPTAHRRLGAPVGVGLDGVGPHDLRHALQATANPMLRFLGPGTPDRHPAEIASTHLHYLLRQTAAWGDIVIMDSPPLPLAAESIIYAAGCGNVLLVIDARRRDLTNVERVLTTLQDRDVHILGVVINRSRRKVRHGGYYAKPAARPTVARAAAPQPVPAGTQASVVPEIAGGLTSSPTDPGAGASAEPGH